MAEGLAWNSHLDRYVPIPKAPLYVIARDKFMSSWKSTVTEEKDNYVVVPCMTREESERAEEYLSHRSEMDHIAVLCRPPQKRSHRVYSLLPGWAHTEWVQVDIRYQHVTTVEGIDYRKFEWADEKMEGLTNEEIAARYRVPVSEVERLFSGQSNGGAESSGGEAGPLESGLSPA
jgi:hypothetical protein